MAQRQVNQTPQIFRLQAVDLKVVANYEIVPPDPRGMLYRVTRAFWMRNIGSTAITYFGGGASEGEMEAEFDLRCKLAGDVAPNWWVSNYLFPYSEIPLVNLHFLQNKVVMAVTVASLWAVDDVSVGVEVMRFNANEAMSLNATGFYI